MSVLLLSDLDCEWSWQLFQACALWLPCSPGLKPGTVNWNKPFLPQTGFDQGIWSQKHCDQTCCVAKNDLFLTPLFGCWDCRRLSLYPVCGTDDETRASCGLRVGCTLQTAKPPLIQTYKGMFSEFTCPKVKPYSLRAMVEWRLDKPLCHKPATTKRDPPPTRADGKREQLVS